MIGRFRSDGVVLFANAAYARACGFSGRDMRGANLREILRPERAAHVQALLSTLTPDAAEVRVEECAGNTDGSEKWTLWKFCASAFDEKGAWREVEVVGIDITETRRTQAELSNANSLLRRAERDLTRAQSVAKIGSWWLDGRSGAYGWSAETYRIFGIPETTPATYEMFIDAVHPDDRARVEAAWQSAFSKKKTDHDIEHRITVKGAIKWVHERASLVWDEDGQLLEACGTCQEITERKGWELELERRVVERTAAFDAARDEAARANSEKTRFLSAASHDLRQPLHAASLYVAALQKRVADEEQNAICQKLEQALASASDMLRALLDISRLESGAVVREPKAFALQQLIERVIANNRAVIDGKGLSVVNMPSDLTAYTDEGLFERIVDNFVANAARYTERGGTISVICDRIETGVRVAVQDTGVGIPEHALEKIFDEYVQVGNSERASAKGLGLGLAIAKHIATLLGCRLDVVSRLGHGSTLSVVTGASAALPAHDVPVGNDASNQRIERPILLLEDDPLVADAVSMILSDAGFAVTSARDGEGGAEVIQKGYRPAAIVSDYWLPHENGVAAIRRLRAAIGAVVPAVLVTGDTSLRTADVDLDCCEVMHKPLDAKHLLSALQHLAA